MKSFLIWFFIVFVLVVSVCGIGYWYLHYRYPSENWEPHFGKEINLVREQLGIPSIPDNWEVYSVRQYESTWRSPNCEEPCHRRKWVSYWSDDYPESEQISDIIEESDTYFGTGYVDVLGKQEREFVNITCQYNPNDPSWKTCSARALVPNKFRELGRGEEVDISTAIQILDEWGISYP